MGAVTVMPPLRSVPETLKVVVVAEAAGQVALRAAKVPEALSSDAIGAVRLEPAAK